MYCDCPVGSACDCIADIVKEQSERLIRSNVTSNVRVFIFWIFFFFLTYIIIIDFIRFHVMSYITPIRRTLQAAVSRKAVGFAGSPWDGRVY